MPRDFEYKDIRTLVNKEKAYLDQNRRSEKAYSDLKNKIKGFLSDAKAKNICADLIRDEVVYHHDNVFYHTDELNEAMKYLYQFIALDEARKKAEPTLKHTDRIKEAMSQVSTGSNFIRWAFANKARQAETLKAVEFLNSDLAKQFHLDSDALKQTVSSLSSINESDAWEAYEKSANPFIEALFVRKEFGPIRGNRIKEFQELSLKADEITTAYSSLNKQIRPKKDHIRKAIDRLKNEETIKIIGTMGIEELSKEHAGIRYKALKDAGVATIGSLYLASETDIAEIRGISAESAYALKRIAAGIYHSVFESTRLKLSADRQTIAGGELVKAVYAYKEYRSALNNAKKYYSRQSADLARAKKYLDQFDSSIRWIFYRDEVRKNARNSYYWLKGTLEGNECRAILQLSIDLTRPDHIDEKTAWDDFAKNSFINIVRGYPYAEESPITGVGIFKRDLSSRSDRSFDNLKVARWEISFPS